MTKRIYTIVAVLLFAVVVEQESKALACTYFGPGGSIVSPFSGTALRWFYTSVPYWTTSTGSDGVAWEFATYYWDQQTPTTGFDFYIPSSQGSAFIFLHSTNQPMASWDGLAVDTDTMSYMGTNFFLQVDAFLNDAFTSGYSDSARLGVASHEVGHTIGLHHDNSVCQVMIGDTPSRNSCSSFTPNSTDANCAAVIY